MKKHLIFLATILLASINLTLLANESVKSDNLKIIQNQNGKYYIIRSSQAFESVNGFLRVPIVDSLNYIDPAIPQNIWVKAYLDKNIMFEMRHTARSLIIIEDWRLKIFNRLDYHYASLNNDSLKLHTDYNISGVNDSQATSGGTILLICIFIAGLIFGSIISSPRGFKLMLLLLAGLITMLFFYFFFVGTIYARLFPLVPFIVGNLVMLSILKLFRTLKKNRS